MDVIKPGRICSKVYRGECTKCTCVVQCTAAENKKDKGKVICPTCGNTISLYEYNDFSDPYEPHPWKYPKRDDVKWTLSARTLC